MSKKPPARPSARREPASVEIAVAPVSWWRPVLREPLALGLAVPVLVRPWLDGITYPTDNLYFVWAMLLLLALWGVRQLFRGGGLRFETPMLLLLGFYVVAAITALGTVQVDATYRSLILWGGHVALFILVTNGLRSRTGVGIVLTAFVVSALAETVWGLVHFRYVLPYVREAVVRDPMLLKIYFGSMEPGPELIHRLQVNRAFGSLLFPNALAAFLIIGIPYVMAGSVHSVSVLLADMRSWHKARGGDSGKTQKAVAHQVGGPLSVLATGLTAWFLSITVLYFLFSFIASFEFPIEPALQRLGLLPLVSVPGSGYQMDSAGYVVLWVLFVALAPAAIGIGCSFVVSRRGMVALGHLLRAACFPPLALFQLAALWVTYSRGGLLALIAAILFTAAVLWIGGRLGRPAGRAVGLAAATALCLIVLAISGPGFGAAENPGNAASPAQAQTAPTPVPPTLALQPETSQPAPSGPPQSSAINQITREGEDLTMQDLMNPASLRLRMSYWYIGLRIVSYNFWTGVGLGNFGTVYPKYQRPGTGDVKAAHNDYLQALCETGIFGFLFFCAFWGYFMWWGARRLLRETDRYDRWVLTGLYASVMAFLIHSAIDFNFFNPALAFFVMLMAGLFYARSAPAETETEAKTRNQLIGIPVLIGAALITGMAVRVYLSDFMVGGHSLINVGNHRKLNAVFDSGIFYVRDLGLPQTAGKYPMKDIITAAKLIPERNVLQSFGEIRVPSGGETKYRPLQPNERVPETAKLVVTKPKEGQAKALEYVDRFLTSLAVADGVFPHSPELAGYFIQWYEMLAQYALDPAARQRYVSDYVRWAEIGVKRSPEQAMFREWYAKALWLRGNIDSGPGRWEFFAKSVEEYSKAANLLPTAAYMWDRYATASTKYGEALVESGQKEAGQPHIDEGGKASRWANRIRAKLANSKWK